jgi:aryl-alcohol dehydrogenase-like predicted oxidoreductase
MVDLGVNWIDTAAIYSLGHSEEVVGRLLREVPKSGRPYIFTTCGLMEHLNSGMAEPRRRVLTPDSIRENCETSLLRLGVQQIDLYQFHWPDSAGIVIEDAWETMVKLAEEGKVRAVGVSNCPVGLLERCENIGHIDSLQPAFSLTNRAAATNEIPWCDNHRTGVICWPASDDWRRDAAALSPQAPADNAALWDALRLIASRHHTNVLCVTIAWTLAWPGVTAAIIGSRYPEQVDGWIGAASLELTQTDLEEIASAIVRTDAGKGPCTPPMQTFSTKTGVQMSE